MNILATQGGEEMKTLCGIAVVVLGLWGAVAPCPEAVVNPNVGDGNSLLRECSDGVQMFETGGKGSVAVADNAFHCAGYVDGILAMHAAYLNRSLLLSPLFCLPPEGIRVGQGIRIIVHYLQSHPERLHLPEVVLAIEAFRDAFPCAPAASRPQR